MEEPSDMCLVVFFWVFLKQCLFIAPFKATFHYCLYSVYSCVSSQPYLKPRFIIAADQAAKLAAMAEEN